MATTPSTATQPQQPVFRLSSIAYVVPTAGKTIREFFNSLPFVPTNGVIDARPYESDGLPVDFDGADAMISAHYEGGQLARVEMNTLESRHGDYSPHDTSLPMAGWEVEITVILP